MTTSYPYDVQKFQRLQQRAEDLRASLVAARARATEARTLLQQQEGQAESLRRRGYQAPPPLARDIAVAAAAVAAAREHFNALTRTYEPLAALSGRLREFLREAGVDLDLVLPPTAVTRPLGVRPTAEDVESHRARIAECKRERHGILRAPGDRAAAMARIDRWLDAAAERANVDARSLIAARDDSTFTLLARDSHAITATEETRFLEAVLAAVARPALRKLLTAAAERDAIAAGGWGLPIAERTARVSELDEQIFAEECEEERAIAHLEALGMSISRRADASPGSVLALDDDAQPPIAYVETADGENAAVAINERPALARGPIASTYLKTGKIL